MTERAVQRCISARCGATFPVRESLVACPRCNNLLDIEYDWSGIKLSWEMFTRRATTTGPRNTDGAEATPAMLDFSGVWRFRDLLPFYGDERTIVTIGEGRTNLQRADQLAKAIGLASGNLFLQYEGFNPSGSFKDNGMTAAFTHARMIGAARVACASTGNTSAALAVFGTLTGIKCFVFIGDGKIAYGKLSQALDYGATTLQIAGDFDACLSRIRHIAEKRPDVGIYLMNSVNPFRRPARVARRGGPADPRRHRRGSHRHRHQHAQYDHDDGARPRPGRTSRDQLLCGRCRILPDDGRRSEGGTHV